MTLTGPWSAKTTSPSRISYSTLPMLWTPTASWRAPSSGSSAISISAIMGAGRRVPSWKLDAGQLSYEASLSVASDEVGRPHRPPVGQFDAGAGVVLRELDRLTPAVDGDVQLVDPAGQDAFDVILPKAQYVGMPRREVAQVERGDPGEPGSLRHLSLREEPIGDATLVEGLDASRVQTAGA